MGSLLTAAIAAAQGFLGGTGGGGEEPPPPTGGTTTDFEDGSPSVGAAVPGFSEPWRTEGTFTYADAGAPEGFIARLTTATSARCLQSWDEAAGIADGDLELMLRTDADPADFTTSGAAIGGVVVRGSGGAGTETGYLIALYAKNDGSRMLFIGRYNNGALTILFNEVPARPWTTNVWSRVRVVFQGARLQVQLWTDGDAPPSGWDYDAIDGAPILTGGYIGPIVNSAPHTLDYASLDLTELAPIEASVAADFELVTYDALAQVNLHDLSVATGGVLSDVEIDWGDGGRKDRLKCPHPGSSDPPVKWMMHAYKASGTYNIAATAFDSLGNTHTVVKPVTVALPAGEIPAIPHGRFFGTAPNGNPLDQYPGIDPRRLRYAQPVEYLDTTRPVVLAGDVLTAATEAELTSAFNTLASGACAAGRHGAINYTGAAIDNWKMPARPFDANGVMHDTYIWIRTDDSVRPVGYDDTPGVRQSWTVGAQLPAFRALSTSQPAIDIGDTTDDALGRYNVRFTGFGITTAPGYTLTLTGASMVSMGKLTRGIIFEQCCSYLPDEQVSQIGVRRDFAAAGGHHAWIDGWHWGNRDYNTDSQCIWAVTMSGPLKIVNCLLGGAGECFMTGGDKPALPTDPELPYRPHDIEVRMCHCWRDQARSITNIRYYDGSGILNPGKTLDLDVPVSAWDAATRTLTLAAPVTVPTGSFSLPNPSLRVDYVIYVRSGAGAGQGARVNSFTDSTHLVLRAPYTANGSLNFRGITTPLDNTSVIELRLKIQWFSKNNGEFKDMRGGLISECVFENGSVGIGNQYNMNSYKTTVNHATDLYPFVCDINVIDCVYLNTYGGIAMNDLPYVAGYGHHGQPSRRYHLENLLLLAGDAAEKYTFGSTGDPKFRPLTPAIDQLHIRGVTAHGHRAMVMSWEDESEAVQAGTSPNKELQSIRGFIASAPTKPISNAYWFYGYSRFDTATSEIAGCAITGTSTMPTDPPGGAAGWYAEPLGGWDAPKEVFVNPVRDDLWGAATDYDIKPELTGLRAATPERLDWPRLKAATAGVRAPVSEIPYQWD